jgi:molecular chaperone DnaK
MPPAPRPPRAQAPQRLPGRVSGEREARALINWLLTQAFEQTGVRVADEPLAYQRIVEAAHKAMQELKTRDGVVISLPFLTADANGPKHFEIRVTREVIQELARY